MNQKTLIIFKEKITSIWIGFLAALQFLTIFPAVVRRPFKPNELGAAVAFYPVVGIVLGLFLVSSYALLSYIFSKSIVSVLVLAVWIISTGALHLDGFLDACDGLFGGHNPQQRFEIMQDERLGAFALAGGVLLILLKYASLYSIDYPFQALLITPMLSRWGMTIALVLFPYARPNGIGNNVKKNANWKELTIATFFSLIAAVIIASWWGLIAFLLVAILGIGAAKLILRILPGLTGDIYGALNELSEVLVLLLLATR